MIDHLDRNQDFTLIKGVSRLVSASGAPLPAQATGLSFDMVVTTDS